MRAVPLALIALLAAAAPAPAPVTLENEFVRLRVNPGPQEAGRFALDTTGGDPSREEDNGQRLVYGATLPWSSFTVVLVDGEPWVFGGESHVRHHAARGLPAGAPLSGPEVVAGEESDAIVTSWALGGVEVAQTLAFTRGASTGVFDTLAVSYTARSADGLPHEVGVLIVLDTMLGSNDGAPLRAAAAAEAAAAETCWQSDSPAFWQAFDSLEEPTIMAQGTVHSPEGPRPDRMMFSNWGKLSHAGWDPACEAGASLVREGEDEIDTAVAIQWSPRALGATGELTFRTDYGLAGVEVEQGDLSLGLTAPSSLPPAALASEPGLVVGYVQNTSGFLSRNTRLSLVSADGLVIEGAANVGVGDVEPGGVRQVTWRITNPGLPGNSARLSLLADSDTLPPNAVMRRVGLPAPPRLEITALGLPTIAAAGIQHRPSSFTATLRVENTGASRSPAGEALLAVAGPLTLAGRAAIALPPLEPGAVEHISWQVAPRVEGEGRATLSWRVQYGADQTSASAAVAVPGLPPHVRRRSLVRSGVVTSTIEGVRLPGFVRLERVWEVPGPCDFVGSGGIAELPGYEVTARCDGSVLRLVIAGDGTPIPPLAGLVRVYHGGSPEAPWKLLSQTVETKAGEQITLEE